MRAAASRGISGLASIAVTRAPRTASNRA
jgi:hypothetical protein